MKCIHKHNYHKFSSMMSDFCYTGAMLKKLARWYKNMQISDKTHIGERNMKKKIFSCKETFSLELCNASNQQHAAAFEIKYNEIEN